MAGAPDASDEDEPQYEDEDFEYVGGGRPPIPKRPPIPTRPASQPGSADEGVDEEKDEEGDEKPQIVVLREGKHLSEREVENIKRKEKGLPPLPEVTEDTQGKEDATASSEKRRDDSKASTSGSKGLSFSSGKPTTKLSAKRKAISQPDSDSENDFASKMGVGKQKKEPDGKEKAKSKDKSKKKPKKETKKLLSFGDEA